MKIMIIEDDEAIRVGLKYYLENKKEFDLILLDINLPKLDGFKAFKIIKKINDIPIIFLTANDLEISTVMGLDMGADDYIIKPFKAKELVSRIKNVLRRVNNLNTSNLINIQNIVIDTNQMKVLKNGKDLMLTALEYKILLILALNPKVVFTREKILSDIWDVNEDFVNDNTLTVYIKRIRQKVEDDPTNPKIILTIRKIGYKIGDTDE